MLGVVASMSESSGVTVSSQEQHGGSKPSSPSAWGGVANLMKGNSAGTGEVKKASKMAMSFTDVTRQVNSAKKAAIAAKKGRGKKSAQELADILVATAAEAKHYESPQEELDEFFAEKGLNSALQAWFKVFDRDQSLCIDYKEFDKGLQALGFQGGREGTLRLWNDLDDDNSGEISFHELAYDEQEVSNWDSFRRWCGARFQGARDMIRCLRTHYAAVNGLDPSTDDGIREREFCEGLALVGWTEGMESMFFYAFDYDNENCLYPKYLKWVDVEVRRFKMKDAAKKHSMKMTAIKAKNTQESLQALKSFKEFLRRQYGPLFRAWRRVLDLDGSMTLQSKELFKAAKNVNWKGNCRALWKALDHDGSGVTSIEELDPHCAQLLAQFKAWALEKAGSANFEDVFGFLDPKRRKKLSYVQFAKNIEAKGFQFNGKQLAHMLDWEGKKYVQESDLDFLQVWRAPAWLTAKPNPAAANAFRKNLVQRYGHVLKAWRNAMDKDGSNSCNWHEFQEAAKYVRYYGDIAGAWLALDEDLSGSISLNEIDTQAYKSLMDFKAWTDDEFGGVKSAFKVLDKDVSGTLTYPELKNACRSFGYGGDCRKLFDSLDQHGDGNLQIHEIYFLDNWQKEGENDSDDIQGGGSSRKREGEGGDQMLEYRTANPGPGAYNVPSSFAAPDCRPGSRHTGSFSFGKRHVKPIARVIGPAKYSPCLQPTSGRKPAWSFGDSKKRASSAEPSSRDARRPITPGPGQYRIDKTFDAGGGPRFSMRPRRALPLHPSATPS
eukprot:TRINITY_DN65276_c0_g1_i1.p1 TRINITY_DN65276_c0_g1~~TRINITY_DN65276_c0_g1_i1.p1  ORF type:complete len:777 (-),score=151.38 TRINITY_DN65276_c0_g1_i1:191-2521(-)